MCIRDRDQHHEKFKNIPSSNAPLAEQALKINYEATDGVEVGVHSGAHYFTIGQRKGLAVGGTVDPLYVIDTDVNENVLYVGEGKNHPGLFRKVLKVAPKEIHWVREDLTLKAGQSLKVEARIRYRQPLQKATIHSLESGYFVSFDQPQSAITPGQFIAWYQKKELLGSGVIT